MKQANQILDEKQGRNSDGAGDDIGLGSWIHEPDQRTREDLIETNQWLTEASGRFQELFQCLPAICFCYDADGRVNEWNRECEAETGYTADQVMQQRIWETFYRTEDEAKLREMLSGVFKGEVYEGIEFTLVRANGSHCSVLCNTFPMRDQTGAIVGAISANINIDGRKRVEAALRDSEERLRMALDLAQMGHWEWRLDTNTIHWTSADALIFGYENSPLQIHGDVFLARMHPKDRPRMDAAMQKAEAEQTVYETDFRIIRDDGTIRWAAVQGRYLYDADGKPLKIQGTIIDVTGRRTADDDLRRTHEMLEMRVRSRTSELALTNEALEVEVVERVRAEKELQLYADIVKHMQIGVHVYRLVGDDKSLTLIAMNAAAESHGKGFHEDDGTDSDGIVPELAQTGLLRRLSEVARSGEGFEVDDLRYTNRDGQMNVFSIRAFPLPGRCVGLTFENVTERRAAEREVLRMHKENAQVLASIGSVLICIDQHDIVTSWNVMADEVFGAKQGGRIGSKFLDTNIQWDWEPVMMGMYECINTGQPVRLDDLRYTRADGKECFLGMTVNPLRDGSGCPSGFLLVATDITKRRVLEGQLAQAQKLESIGHLAAGIAHEINTPIQYVGDNTRFLMDAFGDFRKLAAACSEILAQPADKQELATVLDKLRGVVEEVDVEYLVGEIPTAIQQSLDGVNRVADIVRAMKEFSHPGAEAKNAVDLNRAIESTVTVARNEWKYVADLVTNFDEQMPPVHCYAGEFNQVILNMIVNASHAITDKVAGTENKGTITISTRHFEGWAEIQIADTGNGIAPDVLPRIFDPFFTTKVVGKGTGQGLALSHSVIVEKHGGSIHVDTVKGEGTVFTIRLPLERTL